MCRSLFAATASLLALVCVCAPAQARGDTQLPLDAVSNELYLEVMINDRPTRLIAAFTPRSTGRLAIAPVELAEIGIADEPLAAGGDGLRDLDRLPGLAYHYDVAAQVIRIEVPIERLLPQFLDGRRRRSDDKSVAQSSIGAVLNYTLYGGIGPRTEPTLAAEFDGRAFSPAGVLSQSGITRYDPVGGFEAIRLSTTFAHSIPSAMITYRGGDLISGGLSWTRPHRLGGFQVQRNFSLRPDLVTMPLPEFSGSAAVPSTVEVFANGVRLFAEGVAPGPFTIADLPVVSGTGTARIVVTDALGRTTETTAPFYASASLFRKGLSDFSVEAGFPRRSYGVESFDYSNRVAISGSLRHGLTDTLTLEAHAEASDGLINGGAGVVTPVAMHGLANVAVSASLGRGVGAAVNVGLEANFGRFGLRLRTARTFGDYADVASATAEVPTPGTFGDLRPPQAIDQASLSMPIGRQFAAMTLSFAHVRSGSGDDSAFFGLSYSQRVSETATIHASGFQSIDGSGEAGFFLGLSRPLSNGITATGNVTAERGGLAGAIDLNRSETPEIGGHSWRLGGGSGENRNWLAAGSYRSPIARFSGGIRGTRGRFQAGAEMTGALTVAGGGVFLTNRIDDAFAIVDAGVPDVTIHSENRAVGRTNGKGKLLVTGLRAYQRNTLSIDPENLPLDADPERTEMTLVPADRSGVSVGFGVTSVANAAILIIRDAAGAYLAPGTPARIEGGEEFVVGYDGEAYVRELGPRNVLLATPEGSPACRAEFSFSPDKGEVQPVINGLVCS